jgi:phosphoglucomutase
VYEHVQRAAHHQVVAVMRSEVSAEVVAATLAAHGIQAVSVECFGYPSVDFVQGVRVTVAQEQAHAARDVLRALGGIDPDELDV